jgi:hypothetical protein
MGATWGTCFTRCKLGTENKRTLIGAEGNLNEKEEI